MLGASLAAPTTMFSPTSAVAPSLSITSAVTRQAPGPRPTTRNSNQPVESGCASPSSCTLPSPTAESSSSPPSSPGDSPPPSSGSSSCEAPASVRTPNQRTRSSSDRSSASATCTVNSSPSSSGTSTAAPSSPGDGLMSRICGGVLNAEINWSTLMQPPWTSKPSTARHQSPGSPGQEKLARTRVRRKEGPAIAFRLAASHPGAAPIVIQGLDGGQEAGAEPTRVIDVGNWGQPRG